MVRILITLVAFFVINIFCNVLNFCMFFSVENDDSSDSDDSLSDTEYPESKTLRPEEASEGRALLIEKSLMNNAPAMGEWERHTRVSMYSITISYNEFTHLLPPPSFSKTDFEARAPFNK